MSVLPPPPGDGDDGRARPESHPVHHVPPGGPDLPPLPLGIVIPDDLSGLDEDVAHIRRELRRERRLTRLQSVPILRRFPSRGLPGTLVVLSLFAIALLGTLLMAFPPGRTSPRPTAQPLASPSAKVGTRGGLVPAAELLDLTGGKVLVRALRPAVLVIVPAGCACADRLRSIDAQAHEFGLSTYFVERGPVPAGGVSVATLSQQTNMTGFRDPTGRLTSLAPSADQPAVVPVSPNGEIASSPASFRPGDRLEQRLANVVK